MNNKLQRVLTLVPLTLYGVGTILGAGIYVIIAEVATVAGPMFPLSFLVSAVIAGFCALSYAELSSRFPRSAGEAVYVKEAFAFPPLTVVVGYGVAFTGLLSASTIIRGFYGYLSIFIDLPEWLCTTSLVVAMSIVAIKGVKESVKLVTFVTAIEVVGLLLVLYFGLPQVSTLFEVESPVFGSPVNLSVFSGAMLAFFAFIGFEDMVNMAEETKSPQTTMPKAIILALAISTLFYLLVSVSVLASLNLSEITSSEAPLALIIERYSSLPTEVMGLIGMIAIINGGLVQVVMVSRLIYGMAEINRAPAWFAKVSTKTKTPINATVVTGLAIWALTIFVDLRTLAEGTGTVILSVFALVNLALVQLRRRETSKHPGFRVPLAIPITGFLLCCFLLLNSWILS